MDSWESDTVILNDPFSLLYQWVVGKYSELSMLFLGSTLHCSDMEPGMSAENSMAGKNKLPYSDNVYDVSFIIIHTGGEKPTNIYARPSNEHITEHNNSK